MSYSNLQQGRPYQVQGKGRVSRQSALAGSHASGERLPAAGHRVYEFIGTDSFGTQWADRQRYEIDAGRDEEPMVYTPIYDIGQ